MIRRYRGLDFDKNERQNEILDKIHKYGIESMLPLEKLFLDNIESNEYYSDALNKFESLNIFECDLFTLEIISINTVGNNITLMCNLYTPDMILDDIVYSGFLTGTIRYNLISKRIHNNLKKNKFNVYQFIDGFEFEFDDFMDFVIESILEDLKFK